MRKARLREVQGPLDYGRRKWLQALFVAIFFVLYAPIVTLIAWAWVLGSAASWTAGIVGALLCTVGWSASAVLTGRKLKQHEVPGRSILVAVIGALILLESPGPILFRQERVGRGGRRFRMLKLRSMRLDADKQDHLSQSTLRDDPRLLRIGAFIRRWNLDEVPQFWNVLTGDMSLVGPRPERTFHSEKLSHEIPHYNARLMSKPGITGWAQVNGLRGDTDLTERVRYDLYYLENWSLLLDFQIMFQTFISRKNAY